MAERNVAAGRLGGLSNEQIFNPVGSPGSGGTPLYGAAPTQTEVDRLTRSFSQLQSAVGNLITFVNSASNKRGGSSRLGTMAGDMWRGTSNWTGSDNGGHPNGVPKQATPPTFNGIPVNYRTGGYPESPGGPSIPGSAYDNVVMGGFSPKPNGGGPRIGGGSQSRGRGNGGHAAWGAGGLGSMVAQAGAFYNRHGSDFIQGDFLANMMQRNLTTGGSYSSQRNSMLNQIYRGPMNRGAMSNADLLGGMTTLYQAGGVAATDPRFKTMQSQAGGLAMALPGLGAAGGAAAVANMGTSQAFYGLQSMGIRTMNNGQISDPRQVATQMMNRVAGGRNLNTQQIQAMTAQGRGSYWLTLQNMVASGSLTQQTADTMNQYVQQQGVAMQHGMSASQYQSLSSKAANGDKGAVKSLQAAIPGFDKSGLESMRDLNSQRRTTQADTIPAFIGGLQTANGILDKFNKALDGLYQHVPGLAKLIGGGSGLIGGLGGSVLGGVASMGGLLSGGRAIGGLLGMGGGGGGGLAGLLGGGGGGLLAGLGGRLLGGGALALGGDLVGNLAEHLIGGKQGSARHKAGTSLGRAAKLGGIGAGIGTMIAPGVGTLVGGGIGAGIGALSGIFGGGSSGPGTTSQGKQAASGSSGGSTGADAVRIAEKYLGTPYQWGGNNPSTGFDCSGLVQWSFGQMGVKLPRTAAQQEGVGKSVARSQLQTGDLVFYGNPAEHVGIYVGGGKMLDAPHTGADVRVENLWGGETAFRRVVGSAGILNDSLGGTSTAGSDTNSQNQMAASGQGQGNVGALGRGSYGSSEEASAVMAALSSMGGGASGGGGQSSGGSNGNSGSKSTTTTATNVPGDLRSWATQGLKLAGKPLSWLNGMIQIAMGESGGKNIGQGISDINSAQGDPAFGPWQMISKTFASYAVKGHTNRGNPVDEAASAANYIASRYGDPSHTPGLLSQANGGPYKGYAVGAWDLVKDEIAQLHKGEMILPAKTAQKVRDLVASGAPAGGGGGGLSLTFNQGSIVISFSGDATYQSGQAAGAGFVDYLVKDKRIKQIATS